MSSPKNPKSTSWTTPSDLKAQIQKLWNRGSLLAPIVEGVSPFPLRLTLKGPDSLHLSDRFAEVRDWIARLTAAAGPYRIVWRTVNHRVLGSNNVPSEIWIDTPDDALGLIGKRRTATEFSGMVELTREQEPALLRWLAKRPLRALELAEVWPLILHLVAWLRDHPRPGIYLRQINLPGIHSKFIESHRSVLSELFDLALPEEAIETSAGTGNFCLRYGFRDKPLRVRFRVLDPAISILPFGVDQDITLTQDDFARLDLPVERVFITENEINFLAFPPVTGALVIFGAGYGFSNLATIDWLQSRKLYYWGDIDTHGFAILNQFRELFPHTASFLMDVRTLLEHRQFWEMEPHPVTASLKKLTSDEHELYEQLCRNHWGEHIRLEQEKIGFGALLECLGKM
ncbi:MAG: hypothetical protein HGB36_04495 [Chlorobiaceae bacterium]|nr:hypothetical protein [Chlorobiaceae bacterium]